MPYYRFLQIDSTIEPPSFDASRTDHFAISEPDGSTWYYMPLSSIEDAETEMTASNSFSRYEEVDIQKYMDWDVQWSTHCPEFKDNVLQVDLSKYTTRQTTIPILHLNAGPGFGDLSHPSTRLTLEMMSEHVLGKDVVDIGCGSGILTLAALLLGAHSAIGLDIDPEAIDHSRKNALLNQSHNPPIFLLPTEYSSIPREGTVFLMNMIRTQQQEAWAALPQLHSISGDIFTSGILASERDIYLQECAQRNWRLISEQQQGDWMGFHFDTFA